MKKFLFSIFLTSLVSQAFALAVDEKLTFRVLSTSSSKKTLLMNRGLEDGIALGDHAKFFLTTGVIARAVVVKVSPSRSIWSIYRLIDETQIVADRVLNLKIASPVKVTEDHTKSLSEEPTTEGTEKIRVPEEKDPSDEEELKDVKRPNVSQQEKDDLEDLAEEKPKNVTTKKRHEIEHDTGLVKTFDKDFEFGLNLSSFNLMSTSLEVDGASESVGGGTSGLDFSLQGEKYFSDKSRWYHGISFFGLLHYVKGEYQVTETLRGANSTMEYGLGVNLHFLNDPYAYNNLIGFFTANAGVGSSTKSVEETGQSVSVNGSSQFLSLGPGAKYYLQNGFGGRILFDYYRRVETYPEDNDKGTAATNLTVSGFRFQLGLSYRF